MSGDTFYSESKFLYDIRNAGKGSFEIELDAALKVVSVDGRHLRRWDSLPKEGAPDRQILRVFLDHGVDGRYVLRVGGERALEDSTCTISCPHFRHVGEGFDREKGFIAVVARSNLEVEQTGQLSVCVPIDVSCTVSLWPRAGWQT